MLCYGCRRDLAEDQFAANSTRRGSRKRQSYCRSCDAANHRLRRRTVGRRLVDSMDEHDRCMWHFLEPDYCRRRHTHRNGSWRSCDEHKLPGDLPVPVVAKAVPEWIQ